MAATTVSPAITKTNAARVELRKLRRSFGSVKALSDFSIDVEPGELVALLGPSGCGKTTALRALAGLEDIDSGNIIVDGQEIASVPANKRDLAMVFQAYSLMPHLTVAQNLDFVLKIRKIPAAQREQTIRHYVGLVGLSAHSDHFPHQLSGGQRQRVAIARALAVNPRVLLLDEPLSALDAKVRVQLRDEIRRLQLAAGITALFVTHDQEEALAMADRIAVMHQGKIAQIGTPREVYERPRNEFVARFIGQVNDVSAQVVGDRAVTGFGSVPVLPWTSADARTVLVRPENIRVLAVGEGGGNGSVELVNFLGAIAVLDLVGKDGSKLIAQVSAGEAKQLPVGQSVQIDLLEVMALAV